MNKDHKQLLTRIKKYFISQNKDNISQKEKELEAYWDVRRLYESYGIEALRYSYKNSTGLRSFRSHCKHHATKKVAPVFHS